jgi:ferredoxin
MGGRVVRLRIDGDVCMGHGRCYGVAPDLVTYDDEGFPVIRDELFAVPDDRVAAAEEVAATCPEEAISLVQD